MQEHHSFTLPHKPGTEKRSPTPREKLAITPERDWRRIFLGFVLFNLATIAFHVVLYYSMTQGIFFSQNVDLPEEVKMLDIETLTTTTEHFQERGEELRDRLAEPEPVPEVN